MDIDRPADFFEVFDRTPGFVGGGFEKVEMETDIFDPGEVFGETKDGVIALVDVFHVLKLTIREDVDEDEVLVFVFVSFRRIPAGD